ncbi:MAG TPA: hypothetical protein DCM87_19985 [Planctomycetes bacterium]|nr:hypothetical protein [Planctomycetota bacterium]
MSRRTTVIKQLRASGAEFLLVDGGNALFGAVPWNPGDPRIGQSLEKAKVIIAGYNRMRYHAMAVGVGEIGIGLGHIKELEKLMEFPLLCANLLDAGSGAPVFKPSAIVTVGGVKVGLFGVLMASISATYLERVAPGIVLGNGVAAAKKAAEELRPQVDLVVGLCHMNDDENRALLAQCPAIDAIVDPYCFGGSSRVWIPDDTDLEWVNGRALLRGDGQGSRLGRFDVCLGAGGAPFVPWDRYQAAYEKKAQGGALAPDEAAALADGERRHLGGMTVIPIYPHFAEAPEIKALVDRFRASTRFVTGDAEKEEALARERFLTAEACKPCHEENYAAWRKTPHGRAYATLQKTGDEFRYDCLPCHSVGYGEAFLDAHKVGPYKDVQCESCHGTNPAHGSEPEKNRWPAVTEGNCLVCHNPEHLGMPFDFGAKVHEATCCKVPERLGKKP